MNAKDAKQLGWAALGVMAGVVLYNNALALTRTTVVGKLLEGRLIRSA